MLTDHEHLHALLHSRKKRLGIAIAALCIFIVATLYALLFFVPKKVAFSYEGTTCTKQLSLLPATLKESSDTFRVAYEKPLKVGSLTIASLQTCFTPQTAPKEGSYDVTVSPWGGVVAKKTFQLAVDAPPRANVSVFDAPVPTAKPLSIDLSQTDTVHEYALIANSKEVECAGAEKTLTCDVATLGLEQDKQYGISLERRWRDRPVDTLLSRTIDTLPATKLTKSDIKDKQTIYTRQKDFAFTFDKELTKASIKIERVDGNKTAPVESKVVVQDKKLILRLDKELDRSKPYQMVIDTLEAHDGSTLAKPYRAAFKVSGGPKVTNTNVGATGASLSHTVVISFDQPLLDTQDITKLVSVKGVNASVRKQGRSVYVQYSSAAKCRDFSITIAKGLQSNHKVAQEQSQTIRSRTVCYSLSTIGYSREGRPINAYYFGSGGKTILFTGAIHGSEASSYATMSSWISELDANARQIPAGKQVVVVPMMSPDGYYKYGRFNAKKVNLNRNWPTNNWKKDGGAGGPSPLSEPETKALANLTQRLAPSFVATYHAQGRIVNSNDIGSSRRLGQNYAATVGYRFVADAQTVEVFGEAITGTYEDWLKERGTPCILMELDSLGGNYFWGHKSAMWSLVRSY